MLSIKIISCFTRVVCIFIEVERDDDIIFEIQYVNKFANDKIITLTVNGTDTGDAKNIAMAMFFFYFCLEFNI